MIMQENQALKNSRYLPRAQPAQHKPKTIERARYEKPRHAQ